MFVREPMRSPAPDSRGEPMLGSSHLPSPMRTRTSVADRIVARLALLKNMPDMPKYLTLLDY